MDKNKNRPKYLNLLKISMPITAVVSIGHRIAGLLMVIAIPFVIYAFQLSISSAAEYASVKAALNHPLAQGILVLLVWSFLHHLFSGMRILLIDIDVGVSRSAARISAWLVYGLALLLTILLLGVMR
ncbi:MAG TPA: succinate dehydrogenase, cytochrome b556 subunit [Gammaproteobacteria bacterium]